jgi:hypothetical protein
VLDARTKRYLDAILAAWCAIWILLGVAVHHEVRGLRSLADTVAVAGKSLDDTADTVDLFSRVPVVGGRAAAVADDARRTAASAQASARDARTSIDDLALLLGFAVSATAILPILLAYSVLRVRRR